MLDEKSRTEVTGSVRIGQIIIASLAMGVTMFGGFVLLSRGAGEPGAGMLTTVALGAAAASIVLSLLLSHFTARSGIRRVAAGTWQPTNKQGPAPETDAGRLAAVFQTKTIIGAAALEGMCFLSLFAYMQEHHYSTLLAAAVLFCGLLAHFPTTGRVTDWIEQQLRRIDEERQFSPRA
jgi:hypothetical protein